MRSAGTRERAVDLMSDCEVTGKYHNPTRERGPELRRFRDDCDQSLAHASGYEKHRKSRISLVQN